MRPFIHVLSSRDFYSHSVRTLRSLCSFDASSLVQSAWFFFTQCAMVFAFRTRDAVNAVQQEEPTPVT